MMNFFGFNNFAFPFGMNNWFMPNWSFTNYFNMFQIPYFNMFNNWFTPFNYNNYYSQLTYPSIFTSNNIPKTEKKSKTDKTEKTNTNPTGDVFIRSQSIDYSKDNLKLDNYNTFKGERLANIALNNSVGWTGFCATYVKKSIQDAGLGAYQLGHAYQMPKILRNNPNFKEISSDNVDVSKLPAGCVLVYGKGVEGYSDSYGHTEITTGDGRAVSDGITKNLYKKPSTIFVPV